MQSAVSVSDLLGRIPLGAETILDGGGENAELIAAYRRMNPRARVVGADQAGAPSDGIDCILLLDVLHRLPDPRPVIRRHVATLKPGGTVLITVPNADHWRLTDQRLRGGWSADESEWARNRAWATLAGLRENLRLAGLPVCEFSPAESDDDAAKSFSEAVGPALTALGIDPSAFAQRSAPSHLICRAMRERAGNMVVAGTMLDPVGGVSHVRVVHPLHALASQPGVSTRVTTQLEMRRPEDTTPRIFVLHRPTLLGRHGVESMQKINEIGYLAITEFDDHPEHFHMMRQGGELSFVGVHALQTSTNAMAEILRQFNPEVAVFPNAMVSLPNIRNFADPRCISLFFGALNREVDWRPLMPVINAVAAKAGDRLRFQVIHDRLFFDALETQHKSFTPICDYETYLRILGDCEVSFMPLGDTPFNRAKSDLKFIEAGACRVASLASTVVYGDTIDDGHNGLLFRDPAEFQSRLLRLIAMPELARALGDAARVYVRDHRMLAYQVAPRLAWYRSLWNRREALEGARLARIGIRHAA